MIRRGHQAVLDSRVIVSMGAMLPLPVTASTLRRLGSGTPCSPCNPSFIERNSAAGSRDRQRVPAGTEVGTVAAKAWQACHRLLGRLPEHEFQRGRLDLAQEVRTLGFRRRESSEEETESVNAERPCSTSVYSSRGKPFYLRHLETLTTSGKGKGRPCLRGWQPMQTKT